MAGDEKCLRRRALLRKGLALGLGRVAKVTLSCAKSKAVDGGGSGAAQRSTVGEGLGVVEEEEMVAAAEVNPRGNGGGEFGPQPKC